MQCKLYWQNQGDFLCVKVDRHTKTKKSIFCNLEIFRVREKDFPVEVVELKGTRFLLSTFFTHRVCVNTFIINGMNLYLLLKSSGWFIQVPFSLNDCLQIPLPTFRGSLKANGLRLYLAVIQMLAIPDKVSLSKQM